ncbi:hypothetical protein BD560DRAFT_30898 [Blakeslea trispora]|nr:hypothetical protein BD560DRAFT_30898 [Blakeslea trispora]
MKQLCVHLHTSHVSRSWPGLPPNIRYGMHTNPAIFIKRHEPEIDDSKYQCGYPGCSVTKTPRTEVMTHLTKTHLKAEGIVDVDEAEALNTMVRQIELQCGYTLCKEEIKAVTKERNRQKQHQFEYRRGMRRSRQTTPRQPRIKTEEVSRRPTVRVRIRCA